MAAPAIHRMNAPTPRRMTLGLGLLLVACCALPAAAQVVRCTDPVTGGVTYTDGGCPRGDAAREVEPRRSPQDIAQERAQAAEALQRKHERQLFEAEQRRASQQAERAAAHTRPHNDPSQSIECRQARQNLQDVLATLGRGMYDEQSRLDAAQRQTDLACLSPADYARAEQRRGYQPAQPPYYGPPVVVVPPRPAPPPRRDIVNCNVFRCYDGKGNVYPR
ncbi:DUF4124 domain-containing protein [Oryzisolibacter sp. LB2S]|uniref:DUF4124 domain-containing protein n=1 Tax=Alicycliphilus soli TaxID=3228789 RepID=UPI003457A95B